VTETAGATCPTCTSALPTAGAPCPRCAAALRGGPPSGPYAVPSSYAMPGPYQPGPYQPMALPPAPFPQGGYPPAPMPVRAPKSAGVAVLLTLLWIGAGHLYLDRVGTGLVLMAAHFFVGFFLFFLFAPLGFVVWLAAAIGCSIWVSNLAGQINAGTVPPRETW
jgi:TM2 domain-containing membrane protein YozV